MTFLEVPTWKFEISLSSRLCSRTLNLPIWTIGLRPSFNNVTLTLSLASIKIISSVIGLYDSEHLAVKGVGVYKKVLFTLMTIPPQGRTDYPHRPIAEYLWFGLQSLRKNGTIELINGFWRSLSTLLTKTFFNFHRRNVQGWIYPTEKMCHHAAYKSNQLYRRQVRFVLIYTSYLLFDFFNMWLIYHFDPYATNFSTKRRYTLRLALERHYSWGK